MRSLLLIPAALMASACSTPMIVLENPKTGQVAQCGGTATGSLVGGIVGYEIQKATDKKCAEQYTKDGFQIRRIVDTTPQD